MQSKLHTKNIYINPLLFLLGVLLTSLNFQYLPAQNTNEEAYFSVKPEKSDLWGYINQEGKMVIKPQFEKCFRFSDDGIAVIFDHHDNINFYFIDKRGMKIPTEIQLFQVIGYQGVTFGNRVKGYSNGLVAVMKNGKWGYLNTKGKIAIPLKYSYASEFQEGYAIVRSEDKKYKVINTKGEESEINNSEFFTQIRQFYNGMAAFRDENKKWGFIGTDGQVAIAPKYIHVGNFSNELVQASIVKDSYGYINKKGEWAIQPQFTDAKLFDPESGLARIKNFDKKGYVSTKGEITYIDSTWVSWQGFSDGLAPKKEGELWGFINNKMSWQIQPQYTHVGRFKGNYAPCKINDKWGVINRKGEWVVQPTYPDLKIFKDEDDD